MYFLAAQSFSRCYAWHSHSVTPTRAHCALHVKETCTREEAIFHRHGSFCTNYRCKFIRTHSNLDSPQDCFSAIRLRRAASEKRREAGWNRTPSCTTRGLGFFFLILAEVLHMRAAARFLQIRIFEMHLESSSAHAVRWLLSGPSFHPPRVTCALWCIKRWTSVF